MNNKTTRIAVLSLSVGLLQIGLVGCKEKSESTPAPNTPAKGGTPATATVGAIAQTVCPVMDGNPIDKNVFTEYKGRKVYFCCKACIDKFNADPEKYVAKLPQFKD